MDHLFGDDPWSLLLLGFCWTRGAILAQVLALDNLHVLAGSTVSCCYCTTSIEQLLSCIWDLTVSDSRKNKLDQPCAPL